MKHLHNFVALSACCFMALGGCKPSEPVEEQAPLRFVRTQLISTTAKSINTELPGVVAANQEAELSFRISGKIEKLLVKEGDAVSQGQLLAELDSSDIRIQLKSDQAQYDRALADFNRGKALVGKGTISQADYNQLESSLAGAEAALESTKQNLLYSTLEAPFSGVIAKRSIDNYEEVQAKEGILTLQDVSTIDIKIDIPESIMIRTDKTQTPDVVAIFDAIPNQTFPLTLKEVATQADRETNTYEVTMSMPRVEGFNILPGMSVTARATKKGSTNTNGTAQIYVPAHAILEDSTGRFAFVANLPKGENDTKGEKATVERRSVVTGALSSLGLEVISGLSQGDHLVIAGMSKMYDGLEVRLIQE